MSIRRYCAVITVSVLALAGCAAPLSSEPPLSVRAEPVTPEDPHRFWAEQQLRTMTADDKVRAVLMLHYPGTSAEALLPFVQRYRPGGLIMMGDNVPADQGQLAVLIEDLDRAAGLPLLIGIDQEGGLVARVEDGQPSPSQLREQHPAASRQAFAARGELLSALGVDVNFGIVADVTDDRRSFIWQRVLGANPTEAAHRVAAAVSGEQGHVLSTLKHFPGHGVTASDSHVSIPTSGMTLETWRAGTALPFIAGIEAGAEVVMTGHLRFSAVDSAPASLSAEWHRILRDELGFTGLVVTDDMLMLQRSGDTALLDPLRNAVAALNAGSSLLLYVLAANPAVSGLDPGALIEGLVAAAEVGEIDEDRLNDSVFRVMQQRHARLGFAVRE